MSRAVAPYSPGTLIPAGDKQAVEPLSQGDYEAIKARLPQYRYLLLAKLLRNTGLRETEVMARCAEHFLAHGPEHFIQTYRLKKKIRVWQDVAIHPELGLEVQAFIKGNGIRAGQRVFAFTARQFQNVFRQAALDALGRPAHPHQLRALFTKSLIDGGVPVAVAQKLLGHENERTTLQSYYDLTRNERSAIAQRMPV